MIVNVKGDIIPNDYKSIYDWFGFDSCCPRDITSAIEAKPEGEKLEVKINSPGGVVTAGQEIYTLLADRDDVDIEIEGLAASAASVIAMAGHSSISPVGMLMVHRCSTSGVSGNRNDMKKMAKDLSKIDEALANAYARKSGLDKESILDLMDKSTWLTAEDAVDFGLVDEITGAESPVATAALDGLSVTPDMIDEYKVHLAKEQAREAEKQEILKDIDAYGV